jgi:hypothetical protein
MRKSIVVAVLSTLLAAGCTSAVSGAPVPAPPSAGGCVPNTAPAGFSDSKARFAITPPAGWKTDTSGKFGNAALFVDPKDERSATGPFAANVSVRVSAATFDLAGAVAGFRKELAGVGGYSMITDESISVGNCLPAHLFGGTLASLDSGLKLQNLQVVLVHSGSVIVVTGSALQSNWTDHEAELDKAVRSLTVPS